VLVVRERTGHLSCSGIGRALQLLV
jgi:hypothetical protein